MPLRVESRGGEKKEKARGAREHSGEKEKSEKGKRGYQDRKTHSALERRSSPREKGEERRDLLEKAPLLPVNPR